LNRIDKEPCEVLAGYALDIEAINRQEANHERYKKQTIDPGNFRAGGCAA
jgi:hypothetical protein